MVHAQLTNDNRRMITDFGYTGQRNYASFGWMDSPARGVGAWAASDL